MPTAKKLTTSATDDEPDAYRPHASATLSPVRACIRMVSRSLRKVHKDLSVRFLVNFRDFPW